MTHRKHICPACRKKTGVDIVYGYPSHEAGLMEMRGEIALGGCCIDLEGPERRCTTCGHEWRIKRKCGSDEDLKRLMEWDNDHPNKAGKADK
jgi:hypothetical protein